jgi:hypothetical protein
VHFDNSFALGWICIDRERGSASGKTEVQTQHPWECRRAPSR